MAMRILLTVALSCLLTGCKTRTVVIPADKELRRMEKNKPYTFPFDGWFIPDARMLELMEHLERDASQTNTTAKACPYS